MSLLLAKVDRLPPFVVRLMARKKNGREPLSYTEIANASGVKRSRVATILVAKTWKGVPIDVADNIATACGVDLAAPSKQIKWLKRHCLIHIRNGNAEQRKMFARLLKMRV